MNQTTPKVQPVKSGDPEYDEAQKRVRKIKKFYKDLAGWAGTSLFLLALDLFLSGGISWSKYPVFFYGIFVISEVFDIIRLQRLDKDWEDRQMRRFTGRSAPKHLQNNPTNHDADEPEDYTGELLNRQEREVADLAEYRKLQKPWKEEDLV